MDYCEIYCLIKVERTLVPEIKEFNVVLISCNSICWCQVSGVSFDQFGFVEGIKMRMLHA